MNPFITLTLIKEKTKIRININHIVLYEQKTYSDTSNKYTYMLIQGGAGCTRKLLETPEQIDDMISHTSLSIPFTHIKGV